MANSIDVEGLTKNFKVPVRDTGVKESLRSLFRRNFKDVRAVEDISFELAPGEIVGFLGPNGAGKTTTIKMLTGLLHPTSGDARVLGYQPWQRNRELLRRISLVMGQRNNLAWDLPALDSFALNQAIYGIPEDTFKTRQAKYVETLDLGELVNKPVRTLSLGERMKMEIVGALLHGPEVLFLDEPTIGLDVTMQRRLRNFVLEYNAETGAAVLLTSHYMADVVALARRVIVIDRGTLLFDGPLSQLGDRFSAHKKLTIEATDLPDDLSHWGRVIERSPYKVVLEVAKESVSRTAAQMLNEATVTDLSIEEPPLEDVIDRVFTRAGNDDA